jgi:hypothetical protein
MADPYDLTVRAGRCPCPGTPHVAEHVFLEPTLTLPMAAGAYTALSQSDGSASGYEGALIEAYVPRCIRAWTFVEADENGRVLPVPISRETVERLLPWDEGGLELADTADTLYTAKLMRPLLERWSTPLPLTSMDGLTSAILTSGKPTRRGSKRSSLNGTGGKPSAGPDQ